VLTSLPQEQDTNNLAQDYDSLYEITSASDVFAIGKTILCLMARWGDLDDLLLQSRFDLPQVTMPAEVRNQYHFRLSELVEECMKMEPGNRIKADKLLEAIIAHVRSFGDDDINRVPYKNRELEDREVVLSKVDTCDVCQGMSY